MKTLKLIAAAALACVCVSTVKAQTVVRFTGSTAYRSNVEAAILYAMGSTNGTSLTSGSFAYSNDGASLGKASQAIFYGAVSGTSVTIATSWTGSEGGLQTVAASVKVAFLPVGTPGTSSGTSVALGTDMEVPDVALSDTFQSASAFFGNYQGTNYPSLTEVSGGKLGVVPFKWIKSKGAVTGVANITSQIARTMASGGGTNLSQFTGSHGDEGTEIDFTGRDPDSGTRLTALAEIGVGTGAKTVAQYAPQDSNGAIVTGTGSIITQEEAWPAETIDGLAIDQGNGGYPTGGQLAGAMGATDTQTTGFDGLTFGGYVTYLSTNDADGTALPAGASEISYNGVALGNYSNTTTFPTGYNVDTALTEGAFTFWSYEHMYFRTGSSAAGVASAVATQIRTKTAIVFLTSMQVTRNSDGGTVGSNNF